MINPFQNQRSVLCRRILFSKSFGELFGKCIAIWWSQVGSSPLWTFMELMNSNRISHSYHLEASTWPILIGTARTKRRERVGDTSVLAVSLYLTYHMKYILFVLRSAMIIYVLCTVWNLVISGRLQVQPGRFYCRSFVYHTRRSSSLREAVVQRPELQLRTVAYRCHKGEVQVM